MANIGFDLLSEEHVITILNASVQTVGETFIGTYLREMEEHTQRYYNATTNAERDQVRTDWDEALLSFRQDIEQD